MLLMSSPVMRAEAPVNWDLSEIYASDAAWSEALGELRGKVAHLESFKGRLGQDAGTLLQAMDDMHDLGMLAGRLSSYAGMRADEDTRESGPQGMRQELRSAMADVGAATAWIDPELLGIPVDKLAGFFSAESGLSVYSRYFERLEKRRPHVLDADAERLLGMTQRIRGVGSSIGGLLRDAEIPWSTITLSDGEEVRIDAAGYGRVRQSPNRDDRIAAYGAFYGTLQAFKSSLAATLVGTVQEHVFNMKVRNYDSTLDAAVAANEVDSKVYRMLVQEMNEALPTLHRYLRLRGRMLGIEDLQYHDMYPPLVGAVSTDYTWDNSKKLVNAALAPLGEEYTSRLAQALDGGWVDVYPRDGKRSGAYVNDAAYEVHPYMLLNHQDDYSSASTLAHEAGHLMHSWYSQEALPYPTADYVIFVAEVASTVNEVLFFKHLVAGAESDDERLALLGNFLEGLRTTVFRQTMFAEFELAMHEMGENGKPLTGDALNALYLDLLRRYHGEAEGVVTIDPHYSSEWAYVPHFHYNFYVYQYATSYIAAIAIAEAILQDRPGALDRYLTFLRSGSTRPPVELLASAGVDMTSPEPIQAAMRLMNDVIDQIEALIDKR
jgi:oligoendopeptidase F